MVLAETTQLVGRGAEIEVIDRLLSDARDGLSGALVLRGEAGIGKTALLDHVVGRAEGLGVLRATAVESEKRLGFASLHQLLRPIMGRLDRLPGPQQEALRTAFGLVAQQAPERFLVALATLTLVADAAAERPLLCVVDDAQWLDRESADALAFVARRLGAEGCVLLVSVGEPAGSSGAFGGLPELALAPLDDAAAGTLLTMTSPSPLERQISTRIVLESGGNPLAIVELARRQPKGRPPLPDEPLAFGARLEARFLERVRDLPAASQLLLLLVAAEPTGDPGLLWRAAARLRLDTGAAAPAEAAELLVLGPPMRLRHPLIRSAVYHGASTGTRRRVHEALAAVSDPTADADRRAWHRAAAVVGADDEVAAALERAGERARERGGYAAVAALLGRAAELSAEPRGRSRRLLAAAAAEFAAGSTDRAAALLERAKDGPAEPLDRARGLRLEAMIRHAGGRMTGATKLLVEAALAMAPFDPAMSRATFLEAVDAAFFAGSNVNRVVARDVGPAWSSRPGRDRAPSAGDLVVDAYTRRASGGYVAAAPLYRAAIAAVVDAGDTLRCSYLACMAAGELWDLEALQELASRWVRSARDQGALSVLSLALVTLAGVEFRAGRFAAARALRAEADEIERATARVVGIARLSDEFELAWTGPVAEARAASVERLSRTAPGLDASASAPLFSLTLLDLAVGDHAGALAWALRIYDQDGIYFGSAVLPEVVEAATRTGDAAAGRAALQRLRERAVASGTDLALGLLARSEALLAGDGDADGRYQDAIVRLERAPAALELARTHLLYGEWLRRVDRRQDAREHLRRACALLDAIGAELFAQRARRELLAAGERPPHREASRDAGARAVLTEQEAQIARLAAEGLSNAEIAARLFISASTVAYHLRKVFRKLAVTSRSQLADAMAGAP